jgi:histidine triad (HIT) family protein
MRMKILLPSFLYDFKHLLHLLIVTKKEIHTINEVSERDTILLGKLFLVAKKLAKEQVISESG